jgi:RNA polymerase sigma-70 factor (ECF subfamily)
LYLLQNCSVSQEECYLVKRMQVDYQLEKQQIENSQRDPKQFECLYIRYYESILKFVYKRVEDLDDCRELTAIVFSKALINIKTYRDQGFPFSSWLYRIAINEITQFYRDKTKTRIVSLNAKNLNNIIEDSGEHKTELIDVLKKSLLYLEEEDLTIIELRYFEERPFLEVGEILGITENNAKVKTYRALDKLKIIYNKLS